MYNNNIRYSILQRHYPTNPSPCPAQTDPVPSPPSQPILTSDLTLNITISLPSLLNYSRLPIRQRDLSASPHTNRHNIIHPSRDQETAHSPNPDHDREADGDEERRD